MTSNIMGIINEIENLTKENIKRLSNKFITLCHNEYARRWRFNHKDTVKAINTNYRKRYQKDKITSHNKLDNISPNRDNILNNEITSQPKMADIALNRGGL